ncbi:VOC family protein [Mucilaginibacter mali]|uniref:VOC family protein n=1 Tax=Mucilaginibacter mali TaxID=2740462 RepID=A0A7D4TPU5_9SPHI|nr:VOC family protein [Mucilaginibacter mali]QKJ32113.1 VOC family protein [Mucilaginibacter mali]
MSKINPYIGFNGKTREAMHFYQNIFGGELELLTVKGSPMEQYWQSAPEGALYHAMLTNADGIVMMGSDMSGPNGHTPGNVIQLAITCNSEEEINMFFNKLSEGGTVMDTLKEQFWGAIFGAVLDKYGINWMLNYNKQ